MSDDAFRPARGLESPHAQTLFAYAFRRARAPATTRERWTTPDKDFIDVELLAAPAAAPCVLVLHGLEGSSRAGYVSAVLRGAKARGWGACALNFRSCSGELNQLPRSYHSGETGDIRWALGQLRSRRQGLFFAVGFSLGGNALLRLLEEDGDDCSLTAAAAISVPFSLQGCVRVLDGPGKRMWLYRQGFLRSLKRKANVKARRFPEQFASWRPKHIRGVEAFDDAVTAPIHGFKSAAEYYASCSSGPFLEQIRRPTLLLSSADDPMVPERMLPKVSPGHPYLSQVVTRHGGHVGFVSGSVLRPRYWAEERALRFLERFARPPLGA